MRQDVDVIIVGAGPAGIATARTLYGINQQNENQIRFCLLEGRDRVGGRTYTDHSLGQPVDLGASWIHHYCDNNPITQLAAKHIKGKLGVQDHGLTQSASHNAMPSGPDDECSMENAPAVLCGLVDAVIDGHAVHLNNQEQLGNGTGRFVLFDHDGARISCDVYQQAVASFSQLMSYTDERAAELRATIPVLDMSTKHYEAHTENVARVDCSVQQLIQEKRMQVVEAHRCQHSNQTDQFERVLDFLISGCEQFEGESVDLMSGLYWQAGESNAIECDQFVQRGYGDLLQDLSQEYDFDIRLRHVVRAVDCSDFDMVRVHVDVENDKEIVEQSLVLSARRVLITVPLGCLKRGQIEFVPNLPPWKQLAITHAGFGLMNKIVMQFDKPFWGESTISIGRTDAKIRGRFRWFLSLRPTLLLSQASLDAHPNHTYSKSGIKSSPNILVCFSTAQTGIEIENSSTDEEIMRECMQILRECFGHPRNQPLDLVQTESALTDDDTSLGTSTELLSSAPLTYAQTADDISDPTQFIVTRWWNDRFACGSYSHFAHGANDWTPNMLGSPCFDGRLRFAGEHTNESSIGCVDSAFESGIREAQCVAQSLRPMN